MKPGDDGHARRSIAVPSTSRSGSRRSPTRRTRSTRSSASARAGGGDRAAAEGPDRRRQRRRPIRRPRVRARGDGEARPQRRPRLQGRRDRRDRARRRRRPRSAGSSKRRSACARRRRTSSSCLWTTPRTPALRAWPADHRCEEFSTGVAGAGNTAAETLENGSFEAVGNCRNFVSFRRRQRLPRAKSALVSPRSPNPHPLILRTNEQTSQSNLQRLLFPPRGPLRPPRRDRLPHLPPPHRRPHVTAEAAAARAPHGHRARSRIGSATCVSAAAPSIDTRRAPGELAAEALRAPIALIVLAAYAVAFVLENRKSVLAALRGRDRGRVARLADPAQPRGRLRRRDPALAARAQTPATARRVTASELLDPVGDLLRRDEAEGKPQRLRAAAVGEEVRPRTNVTPAASARASRSPASSGRSSQMK